MMPTSSFPLSATPDAPKEARARMQQFLAAEQLAGNKDVLFLALLLTSELVNHAVEHDDRGKAMTFLLDGSCLRVELSEDDCVLPWQISRKPSAPPRDSLSIIDTLAARWGGERADGGSRVWFELDCVGAGPELSRTGLSA